MTKSELKTGMIATTRDGTEYMVLIDSAVNTYKGNNYMVEIKTGNGWLDLKTYNEDLTDSEEHEFDIMKIEIPTVCYDMFDFKCRRNVLWERKEKKRYTYAQLKEILGTEFEVVG